MCSGSTAGATPGCAGDKGGSSQIVNLQTEMIYRYQRDEIVI